MIRFALLFLFAATAHAFPVCDGGAQYVRLEVVESIYPAAPCAAYAANSGNLIGAGVLLQSGTPGCAVAWEGAGMIAVPPLALTPDRLLGHELRHLFVPYSFHLWVLGGLDYPCDWL